MIDIKFISETQLLMQKQILIVAKTYPTPSKKYGELVCTAGIDENNNWFRLYPVPFRKLNKENKYKKYQWINVEVEKDLNDPRFESFKIIGSIEPLEIIDTKNGWSLKKEILIKNIYTNKSQLIYDCRLSEKRTSLAIFKPNKILDFYFETNHEANETSESTIYKLPYKFYYKFTDNEGKISNLQIIDWEIGELTRKLLRQYKDDENKIEAVLRQKYFHEMLKKDVYLFLGTNKIWHIRKSSNPFMIIGIFLSTNC